MFVIYNVTNMLTGSLFYALFYSYLHFFLG